MVLFGLGKKKELQKKEDAARKEAQKAMEEIKRLESIVLEAEKNFKEADERFSRAQRDGGDGRKEYADREKAETSLAANRKKLQDTRHAVDILSGKVAGDNAIKSMNRMMDHHEPLTGEDLTKLKMNMDQVEADRDLLDSALGVSPIDDEKYEELMERYKAHNAPAAAAASASASPAETTQTQTTGVGLSDTRSEMFI